MNSSAVAADRLLRLLLRRLTALLQVLLVVVLGSPPLARLHLLGVHRLARRRGGDDGGERVGGDGRLLLRLRVDAVAVPAAGGTALGGGRHGGTTARRDRA